MSKVHHSEHGAKFVKGAAILSITGIIAKVFGAFFRIPLNNWIGAAGMSYYGVAYPIYSFFLIIATAGLPVAISKMVSERVAIGDYINAHRVYKVSPDHVCYRCVRIYCLLFRSGYYSCIQ